MIQTRTGNSSIFKAEYIQTFMLQILDFITTEKLQGASMEESSVFIPLDNGAYLAPLFPAKKFFFYFSTK